MYNWTLKRTKWKWRMHDSLLLFSMNISTLRIGKIPNFVQIYSIYQLCFITIWLIYMWFQLDVLFIIWTICTVARTAPHFPFTFIPCVNFLCHHATQNCNWDRYDFHKFKLNADHYRNVTAHVVVTNQIKFSHSHVIYMWKCKYQI